MKPSLSKFVPLPDADLRLQKIWLQVAERTEHRQQRRTRRWRWGAALCLGAALAAGGFYLLPATTEPSAFEQAVLETAGDSLVVDLQDGSRLELGAETRLEVKDSTQSKVRVALQKGHVSCNVAHRPERRFSVMAGGVEVRVTGTRFDVDLDTVTQRVQVGVSAGSVEVFLPRSSEPVRRLGPGEQWSVQLPTVLSSAAPPPSTLRDEASAEPSTPKAALRPERVIDGSRKGESTQERRDSDQDDAAKSDAEARALLERANDARREGDAAAAAQAYERLLADYPSNARVGLAAFELGRLRMDRLGDLPGAVRALKRAVTAAPGAGFREDAMARLVQAYHAMNSTAACKKAKKAYLDSYPQGVHAAKLRSRCGS